MKLVYTKAQKGITVGQEVKVGDKVRLLHLGLCEVTFFRPPHKSSSEGKISLKAIGADVESEFYVGVIGAKWIEREDRLQPCGHPESAIVSHGITHHCGMCEARPLVNETQWEIVDESVHGGSIMVSNCEGEGGTTLEFTIKIIDNKRIVIECEDLHTGKPIGYQNDGINPSYHLPK